MTGCAEALDEVNEGSTSYLDVTFNDKDGAPDAPTTITAQIDNLTTGVQIRAPTPVTPAAATVQILITATENAIGDQSNEREWRRVTVVGDYGAGEAVRSQHDYYVVNLSQVT